MTVFKSSVNIKKFLRRSKGMVKVLIDKFFELFFIRGILLEEILVTVFHFCGRKCRPAKRFHTLITR